MEEKSGNPVFTEFLRVILWKIEKWTSILGPIFPDSLFDCYWQMNEHRMGIFQVHIQEGQKMTYKLF